MNQNQIEVVDPTRLRASLQCLRYYYWEHERNIIPTKPRMPLIHGIGIHDTLEAHYHGASLGAALQKYDKIWDEEVVPYQNEMSDEDPKRNPRRWAETFILYRQRYKTEPFEVLILPNGKPAIEVPFFLPLTKDLALAGIIDLIIKYLGQIMLVDHKTTSYLNQKWIRSFNPNHQFSAYLLAANELLKPTRPITTLLVNAIKVHATDNRLEAMFDRIPTTRTPNQLIQFKEEMIAWWTYSVRAARKSGSWPRNDDRCERWPESCVYKDLCTELEVDYRKLIPSPTIYKTKQWNPIVRLQEHGLQLPEGVVII